ncbi:MAG: BamA/TamA family outer membrane protein [Gemmatimonadales bacterium]|jgi:Tol biopolymer transport system component
MSARRAVRSAGLRSAGLLAAALLLASGLAPESARAQYFGRNKVQYDSFDFQVLETEHFDIYYYEDASGVIDEAGRMAERWYARISRLMDHQLRGRQPLILYTSHPDFEQTNALFGDIGEATGGATEALKRRIVLPLAGPLNESDHVIGHELVHAFQYDMTTAPGSGIGFQGPRALALPLWFIEGMAEYLSLGPVDPNTAMWMRDAAACGCKLPTLRDLRSNKYFPYRWGQAFWAYVAGEYGDETVGKIFKVAGRTGDPQAAIQTVLQRPVDAVISDWHQSIIDMYTPLAGSGVIAAIPLRYTPIPEADSVRKAEEKQPAVNRDSLKEAAADALRAQNDPARELISERTTGGRINVSPSLSPDGSRVAFLSEKTRFSIEMFIADAETGEIRRKLTKTATDPHFESLQFINSSGAWRPDGRAFAFATVVQGDPAITVVNPENGDKLQEIRFPSLGEIYTPSYSPDGRRLVFAAVVDGYTDLFVVDLQTEQLRRLTNDLYSDLQPTWSPDGDRIAFVTDRFGTDLATLTYGDYRLGLIPADGGAPTELPGFDRGKHVDPQWAGDGQSLYFVSDADGISNVYRYDFEDGQMYRVTNLYTGVSGITALSPTLTVARSGNRLVYTAYQLGNQDLYAIDDPAEMRGQPVALTVADASPEVLPPPDREEGLLNVLLDEPQLGLPDTITFDRHDYEAGLTLDYVSQPQVGAGVDRFGTVFAGGISMYFSDMLGNRNLSALANINSSYGSLIRSSTLVGAYENRRTRWNWGFQAGQIPYLTRRISTRAFVDGYEQTELLQWQISRQLTAGLNYPFSRSFRWEVSAGYQNIDFAYEQRTRFYNLAGNLVGEDKQDFPAPSSLNLAIGSTALVYDNTIFGGVGPILGQRYRLEVAPRFGSLDYNNVLIDVRKYVMPVRPLTLAGRVLHFGRYGADAEDPRLNELYLGYGSLIRGYNDGSFGFEECGGNLNANGTCPVFDQLFGSRLALANVELRLPLLGYYGIIESPGVPPLELAAFFDAGTAWTKAEDSELFGGDRAVVTSHGVAARLNLLGLLVVELDYVHPNDRPLKGWYWQFNLVPAF